MRPIEVYGRHSPDEPHSLQRIRGPNVASSFVSVGPLEDTHRLLQFPE